MTPGQGDRVTQSPRFLWVSSGPMSVPGFKERLRWASPTLRGAHVKERYPCWTVTDQTAVTGIRSKVGELQGPPPFSCIRCFLLLPDQTMALIPRASSGAPWWRDDRHECTVGDLRRVEHRVPWHPVIAGENFSRWGGWTPPPRSKVDQESSVRIDGSQRDVMHG